MSGASGWGSAAFRRIGAVTLALVCGIAVPLSPLAAEYVVTGQVARGSWSAVGVTYVAGVGLVSRSQTILVIMLLAASVLAFLYGVDMKDAYDHIYGGVAAVPDGGPRAMQATVEWVIGLASLEYCIERALRHLVDGKPFLET